MNSTKRYQIIVNGSNGPILTVKPTEQWQTVLDSDRTIWACFKEQEIIEYTSIDAVLDALALMADVGIDTTGMIRIANKLLMPWIIIDRVGSYC